MSPGTSEAMKAQEPVPSRDRQGAGFFRCRSDSVPPQPVLSTEPLNPDFWHALSSHSRRFRRPPTANGCVNFCVNRPQAAAG
jgi:hypothetical protein